MSSSWRWSDYATSLQQLAGAGEEWSTAEQTAEEALRLATRAADVGRTNATAEVALRASGLQGHLDGGREHLRGVAQEDLLPRRIPSHKSPTPSTLDEAVALQTDIQRISHRLYTARRDAEQRRLDDDLTERRRRDAEAARAVQMVILRRRLIIAAGVGVLFLMMFA
jgi:hypothetical protein